MMPWLRSTISASLIIGTLVLVFHLQILQNRQNVFQELSSNLFTSLQASSPTSEEGELSHRKTVSCVNGKSMATGGFCLSKDNVVTGANWLWDSEVCKGLEELFGHATVVDFGAGLGHYGRCLLRIGDNVVKSDSPKESKILLDNYKYHMKESGLFNKPKIVKSWKGYDGAENIEDISSGFIQYLDLGKDIDLNYRWDWAISIEVGEHIPADREDVFIDNVARHACKGIVLSWGVPGQNGQGHINNQYNSHVIDQLKQRGFHHDLEKQTTLRQNVLLPWFLNTIMVFTAENKSRCT